MTSPASTQSGPALRDVREAADRISPYIRQTPLLLAEVDGRGVALKLEHLQLTGSFKVRGALNALLSSEDLPHRVITASGGNHGIAVATAARLLGFPALVYVPETAPPAKVDAIVAAGAQVMKVGSSYAEAAAEARAEAARGGGKYLHAYDEAAVIAGQGTVTLEVVDEAPEIDVLVVAGGGGGLAAGTAVAAGRGRTTVVVEPEHCNAIHNGLAAGRPVESPVDSVAASSLGATMIGEIPLSVLSAPEVVSELVTDEQIKDAQQRLWREFKLAVEPGGAVAFAAFLAGKVPGELPCVIICGANAEWIPV
ncbi:pyridoxal-phosphate dependent enzyme [Pseudonocardiaceae bacterium YIM PH 21723]|nr:pyridoxal-phosphate dependent enzyme [Pseudonocardiaceae bacterium YIM PH 21723]